ncbi:MAG: dockerin type I repeat-containing protein [Oscillospiraceae bacterium]|nr:dockerin type I repeat-containing protein [Oscillospiraceae bacterium]
MFIKNERQIPKKLISMLIVLTLMLSCFTFTASASSVSVTDFSVADMELIENYSGYEWNDYNEETGECDLTYFRYEPYYALRYTVSMSDGTTYEGSNGEFYDDYGVCYSISIDSSQSYENQWKVGKSYPVTVTLYADDTEVTSTTATVKIVENPIENITVEPISLIEYTNGYFTEDYETGEEYYEYSFDSKMNISILWKDGTTTETDGYGVNYNDNWYRFETITNQSAISPWTAGNTYSAEISILNKTVDVPVTITESPVESITAEPVTLLENADGYIAEDLDTGEEYFCYELSNKMHATILWKDGTTTETENSGLYYDDEWYSFDVTTNQSADNPWTAGNTYFAQVSLMGVSVSVPVTVVKAPVKSITAKPVSLIEYTNGHMTEDYETGEEYYHYSIENNMHISVLWEDGTTTDTYGYGVNYKGEWYSFDIATNQSSDNPWTVGNTYSAQVSLMGVSTSVPVTVVEAPVESIKIEPVTLLEYTNGYFDGDYETGEEYFYYAVNDKMHVTVLWKDGTTTETDGNGVNYEDNWYSFDVTTNQSVDNPWTAGNTYFAQVSLMGASASVPVTIIESPIESIELKKLPDRTTYNIGEVFSLKGAVIRINYKDGTYEDITVDYSGDAFALCGYDCYVKRLGDYLTMYIDGYRSATTETSYFTVSFLDNTIEVPISVTDRSIVSVDAQNKGSQLEVTVGYSDGTEQAMNILGLVAGYGDISDEGTVEGGILITDKAILNAEVLVSLDKETMLIRVHNSDTYVSTGKIDSVWWNKRDIISNLAYAVSSVYGEIESYTGEVTAENIDALAKIVCIAENILFSEDNGVEESDSGFIIPAKLIRDGFVSVFGVTPDLSLSKNYNADKDTYSLEGDTFGVNYKQPIQIEYKDGITVAKVEWSLSDVIETFTLDDEMKLIEFEFTTASGYQLGDVNKDNKINVRDATEIQKHVAKIISLDNEAQMVADYNGDGRISVKDATEIQKKIAGKI